MPLNEFNFFSFLNDLKNMIEKLVGCAGDIGDLTKEKEVTNSFR